MAYTKVVRAQQLPAHIELHWDAPAECPDRSTALASLARLLADVDRGSSSGDGAGLLNQTIDPDLRELCEGSNVIEFSPSGTRTGAYRIRVLGVDPVLTTAP